MQQSAPLFHLECTTLIIFSRIISMNINKVLDLKGLRTKLQYKDIVNKITGKLQLFFRMNINNQKIMSLVL